MRCYLLNSNEQIIHAFDAADNLDARQQMLDKCVADGVTYILAVAIRRGRVNIPPPMRSVTDEAV